MKRISGGPMTTWWRLRVLAVVVALGILASTTEAAERRAVRTMTEILLTFNHSPSPADREALAEILHDEATTACERVVARTLLNLRHITSAEDKRTLDAMITDHAIPPSLRTLATAIVNLTHTVTDADRQTLKALLERYMNDQYNTTIPEAIQPGSDVRVLEAVLPLCAAVHAESALDEALAESFPASDPPPWNSGTATVAPLRLAL